MHARLPPIALLAAAALIGLTGCGSGPKDTVSAYLDAVADDDGQAACDLLAPAARAALTRRYAALGGADCPETIGGLVQNVYGADAADLRDASVTDERRADGLARVTVTLDDRQVDAAVRDTGDGWRLLRADLGSVLLGAP